MKTLITAERTSNLLTIVTTSKLQYVIRRQLSGYTVKLEMNSFVYNLYQYFFGKIQPRKPEDQSVDSSTNMTEEWNSMPTSTITSKNSIEMNRSPDDIHTFLSFPENMQLELNAIVMKIQDIENKLLKDCKNDIEDKSKDTNHITYQIPNCTELYQCLQNTVKELEDQKYMFDSQLKGLSLNLNSNNIRLVSVENDVKSIILKQTDLSQMYESLQGELEMFSKNIKVKFDHIEQMLSQNTTTADVYCRPSNISNEYL
ncbi:Uncharacterized protein FWK35_00025983 [Aphis craccivora]|uniref:Uncharacterized protein n=1 Tax=Aphis craccivora TaxID=307492 RepID=A0A6G0Y5T1_APHCR|nr:Uncharacterized protein FWK35_00025983 [Aphis craccivora]